MDGFIYGCSLPKMSYNESPKEKTCGVCGDLAKNNHFGGLSCESCKSFFRRAIQTKNYHTFSCYHQSKCVISPVNRKFCRFCRMNRCFAIGMDKTLVRTVEERRKAMKERNKKTMCRRLVMIALSSANNQFFNSTFFQNATTSKAEPRSQKFYDLTCFESRIEKMLKDFSSQEIKEIKSIVEKYSHANEVIPFNKNLRTSQGQLCSGEQLETISETLCRRFSFYVRLFAEFQNLDFQDQATLLKSGIIEMSVLRSAFVYDSVRSCWPSAKIPMYKDTTPVLYLHDIAQLTSSLVLQKHIEFINCIQQMEVDEIVIMLLVLVVLFNPERKNLIKTAAIERTRSHYVTLLERYVKWRYGARIWRSIFSNLIIKLSDLRELSDSYDSYLKFGSTCDEFWKCPLGQLNENLIHLQGTNHGRVSISNGATSAFQQRQQQSNELNNWISPREILTEGTKTEENLVEECLSFFSRQNNNFPEISPQENFEFCQMLEDFLQFQAET